MAILDAFKKKDTKSKAASKKKEENVLDLVQEPTVKSDAKPTVLKENTGHAHRTLHRYHLSEKSNLLSNSGRYVFKVSKTTNKIEVKKAVQAVYDVHVVSVNIVNVTGKKRRQGRSVGRTEDWKKAIVTLKEGERISGLAEGV
jgi:large subunit ribosomal protein L23